MTEHYIKCNLFFYFYLKRGVDYYVASSGQSTQLTGLKITYVPGGSTQSPIKGNQHKTPTCWISAHKTYQTRGGRCHHSVPWRIFRKPRIRSWFFFKRNSRWLPSYWKQIIFKTTFSQIDLHDFVINYRELILISASSAQFLRPTIV